MMKLRRLILLLIFVPVALLAATLSTIAGDDSPAFTPAGYSGNETSCSLDFDVIIQSAALICEAMGRDQACYGNNDIEAFPQSNASTLNFSQPGDLESVSNIKSLHLSPMSLEEELWGIAQMRLLSYQAISGTEDVTVFLFGDIEIDNAVESRTHIIDVTISSNVYANVRRFPTVNAGVVASIAPGETVSAIGRLEDASWLRVETSEGDVTGWLSTVLIATDEDISQLLVETSRAPLLGPMQAFYFQSGESAVDCEGIPPDGLLIQTPNGLARVTLLINEVTIELQENAAGSTVFLTSQPDAPMVINVIEGAAVVGANGNQVNAPAGSQVDIPMNPDQTPSGGPNQPEPYDEDAMGDVPVDEDTEIPSPATEEEIEDSNTPPTTDEDVVDNSSDTTGEDPPTTDDGTGDGGNTADCPGNSCNSGGGGPPGGGPPGGGPPGGGPPGGGPPGGGPPGGGPPGGGPPGGGPPGGGPPGGGPPGGGPPGGGSGKIK